MNFKNLLFVLLFSALLFCLSCNEEEEEPEPDPREIITGTWLCDQKEIGDTITTTFLVTITELPGSDNGLKMNNFGILHGDVLGYLNGNLVDIPSQEVTGIPIEGIGYILSDTKSNWEYTMVIQGDTVDFMAGFTPKQ